jgi:hypothetical protein
MKKNIFKKIILIVIIFYLPYFLFSDINTTKISKNLFDDFKFYIENIQGTNKYNRYENVIAIDKARALLKTYYRDFNKEQLEWIKNEYSKIDLGSFSIIYSGYSKSGLHVILICEPGMSNNYYYYETANKIRGKDDETNFIDEFDHISYSTKKSFFLVDLYVEDLNNLKENKTHKVSLEMEITMKETKIYKPYKEALDKELNDLFVKYKRDYNTDDTINNNEWKLFAFNAVFRWPIIYAIIDNERILLENY